MKRFSEQLHKQAQTVKLKKSEQADLRERLVSYMEYHPLPADMKTAAASAKKSIKSPILTEAFAQYSIPYQSFFKFGSMAAVFVLLIVPFMAERAVPGDSLYAVKVQFNEEVRSTLTWGSYEKVEWETERLNRRIAEARLLADEGLLTPEAEASVAAAVKEHSDNAKREIEVLRQSDADEAAIATIAFDSSIEVQAQALQNMPAAAGEAAISQMVARGPISDVLDESLEKPINEEILPAPAFDKLMARIELNTTRVRELRDSLEGVITDQELVDVTRRIDDIDRSIAAAIELATNNETELTARESLVEVLTRTQKLIVFMSDLEVREQVGIESVVPVVLTKDEMLIERSTRGTELEQAINQINAILADGNIGALNEKLVDSSEKLTIAQQELPTVTDYKEFIQLSDNALALAADSLRLVEQQGLEVPEIEVEVGTTTESVIVEVDTASSTEEITEEEIQAEPEAAVGVEEAPVIENTPSTTVEIDRPE